MSNTHLNADDEKALIVGLIIRDVNEALETLYNVEHGHAPQCVHCSEVAQMARCIEERVRNLSGNPIPRAEAEELARFLAAV